MITSINPGSTIFLSNLQQTEDRISQAERQLSSGLRVQVASDAPDQITSILQLRAQIAGVQQTQNNLATVTPLVNAGENAIEQAIQVLDTATSLAAQASGNTLSTTQMQQLVPQAQAVLQQLVSLSQTAVNGQYIFSGDQVAQPVYSLTADGNGVQQNFQPGSPGQIEDANGVPFSIGLTAPAIFDDRDANGNPTSNNVFSAVTGLLSALQNGDSTGVQNALGNIKSASSYLNGEASFYGAAQNSITAANSSAATTLTQLQQQLGNEQDADGVQASIDLQGALSALQAAMAAQGQNKPQSLFNYLG